MNLIRLRDIGYELDIWQRINCSTRTSSNTAPAAPPAGATPAGVPVAVLVVGLLPRPPAAAATTRQVCLAFGASINDVHVIFGFFPLSLFAKSKGFFLKIGAFFNPIPFCADVIYGSPLSYFIHYRVIDVLELHPTFQVVGIRFHLMGHYIRQVYVLRVWDITLP